MAYSCKRMMDELGLKPRNKLHSALEKGRSTITNFLTFKTTCSHSKQNCVIYTVTKALMKIMMVVPTLFSLWDTHEHY